MKWFRMTALCLVLALSLCGCTIEMPNMSDLLPEGGDAQGTDNSVPESSEEAKPARPVPQNFLGEFSEDYNSDTPVFGNDKYLRRDITSVKFLDSLDDMPDDAWDISRDQDKSVMAWVKKGSKLYIAGEGGVTATVCKRLFAGYANVTTIDFNDCFYTDNVTDMRSMFYDCYDLTELDLSFFVTSNARDMRSIFEGCDTLTELDLSSFDTAKATQMSHMFFNCSKLKKLDISSFNTSNVEYFDGMFGGLWSLPELDVSHFDTSKAIDMSGMFYSCAAVETLDLSNFDTSNVVDMTQMFLTCKSLKEVDLSSFDTSKVTRFGSMFGKCESLKELDLSNFNTANSTDFGYMFAECHQLKTLDLSSFDFSKAEDTAQMFYNAPKLTEIGCTIKVPDGCDDEDMYTGSGLK